VLAYAAATVMRRVALGVAGLPVAAAAAGVVDATVGRPQDAATQLAAGTAALPDRTERPGCW
jgi:hypothetical protein